MFERSSEPVRKNGGDADFLTGRQFTIFEVHSYPVKDPTERLSRLSSMAGIFPRARVGNAAQNFGGKISHHRRAGREGIFIVDAEDKLIFANNFLAGMLGLIPERSSGVQSTIFWERMPGSWSRPNWSAGAMACRIPTN